MDRPDDPPLRIVNAAAPIRICDNGGWTDTWFARHGKVFNIAVEPCVQVQVTVYPRSDHRDRVVLCADNYGERYAISPGEPLPGRHPLLEAAVDSAPPPEDRALEITIQSDAPAGCSTGTSAAVAVALLGALDALTPGRLTPHEIAYAAHRLEVERLGLQCGIQDQLCSAYGGINFIEMHGYPHATVTRLTPADELRWELERRLVLVFLGRPHSSSALHDKVIRELAHEGGASPRLDALRRAAERARDALYAGDLTALGCAMQDNTEAQRELHPDLVGADAQSVIALARAHGALGWKVNGAGGEGGSITLLCGPSAADKRRLLQSLRKAGGRYRPIPIRLSTAGLRVWDGDRL